MQRHNTDYNLKIMVLGNPGTGKSKLISRFTTDRYDPEPVQFSPVHPELKIVTQDEKNIALNIFEYGENYRDLRVFRGTQGVMIVYDVNNRKSFENAKDWYEYLRNTARLDVPVTLVANKTDLPESQDTVSSQEGEMLAKKLGAKYIEVSAKSGNNVTELFTGLTPEMVRHQSAKPATPQPSVAPAKPEPRHTRTANASRMQQSSSTTSNTTKKTTQATTLPTHKILVMGDAGVGKTNLIANKSGKGFNATHNPTFEHTFTNHLMTVGSEKNKLQIWDVSNAKHQVIDYYKLMRDTKAIVLVYDVTNETSFANVRKIYNALKSRTDAPITIVANKTDLPDTQRKVSSEQGLALAHELNANYVETSAKSSQNVEALFTGLITNNTVEAVVNPFIENKAATQSNTSQSTTTARSNDDSYKSITGLNIRKNLKELFGFGSSSTSQITRSIEMQPPSPPRVSQPIAKTMDEVERETYAKNLLNIAVALTHITRELGNTESRETLINIATNIPSEEDDTKLLSAENTLRACLDEIQQSPNLNPALNAQIQSLVTCDFKQASTFPHIMPLRETPAKLPEEKSFNEDKIISTPHKP